MTHAVGRFHVMWMAEIDENVDPQSSLSDDPLKEAVMAALGGDHSRDVPFGIGTGGKPAFIRIWFEKHEEDVEIEEDDRPQEDENDRGGIPARCRYCGDCHHGDCGD